MADEEVAVLVVNSSSGLRLLGFACDAPRAVFPMIAGSLPIDTSVARGVHLEICTLFLRASCLSAFSLVEMLR